MMFFALVITMCIQAISTILQKLEGVFASEHAFKDLSVPFICMLLIAFLAISSIKIAGTLCNKFVGGSSNSAFQKEAKALIVGAAKWLVSFGTRIASVAMPPAARNAVNRGMDDILNITKKGGN